MALFVSSLPIIANFGITVVFSLVGAIILMPAALAVVDRLRARLEHRREAGAPAQAAS